MAKIIRNWGYLGPTTQDGRYSMTEGQLMNGFPMSIQRLWAHLPFFPGNVPNAYTYDFPVKFQDGIDNILASDMSMVNNIAAAARQLETEGCRVSCANCVFFRNYQRLVAEHPDIGTILLECTDMPPYAYRIQTELGLPLCEAITLIRYVKTLVTRTPCYGSCKARFISEAACPVSRTKPFSVPV